jgi:hypothetical protein
MKKKGNILLLFILACFQACIYTEKASKSFMNILQSPDTSIVQIKFNGAYHRVNKEGYHIPIRDEKGNLNYVDTPFLHHPVFFFKNGLVLNSRVTFVDTNETNKLLPEGSKYKFSYNKWGVYNVDKDTIHAIIYLEFKGKGFKSTSVVQCYFEGFIKNKDTILNWRLVEPYPKVSTFANEGQLEFLKTPTDLFFKPVSAKKRINPENAWINEFKKVK